MLTVCGIRADGGRAGVQVWRLAGVRIGHVRLHRGLSECGIECTRRLRRGSGEHEHCGLTTGNEQSIAGSRRPVSLGMP